MKKVLVLAVALTLVLSVAALAGPGMNPNLKVAVHVKADPTSCTKNYPTFPTCAAIVTTWAPLGNVDVMPVFYDMTGYGMVEVGLTWPLAWGSASFFQCKGDLKIGSQQWSADDLAQDPTTRGVAIAWTTCQMVSTANPWYCYLIATSPGMVCPGPSGNGGAYGAVDCSPDPGPWYETPIMISCAGIGGLLGDDPCRIPPTAVEQSTWGQIKSIFK